MTPLMIHRRGSAPRARVWLRAALALLAALTLSASPARALDDRVRFSDTKLIPLSLAPLDHFGASVDVRGYRALVGDPLHNQVGDNSGAAYLFKMDDGKWLEEATLLADDLSPLDGFGTAVGLSRYTAIVGAPLHNAVGNDSGAAYVFKMSGGLWGQEAELLSSNLAPLDAFGQSVGIYGDTAVVGAPLHNAVGSDSGAAYVFRRIDSKWVQEAMLLPSDLAPLDHFGASVAIGKNTIVVGSPLRNDVGNDSGTAYVFRRHYGVWEQDAKLTPLDLAPLDEFGSAVSVYGDMAVVGSPLRNEVGDNSGAAYVFHRKDGRWMQEAKLLPDDLVPLDRFGSSVAIDGNSVVVGSPLRNDVGDNSGAAYLFRRMDHRWVQRAKLSAADLAPLDTFGASVGLSWETAIAGAPLRNDVGDDSGAAYLFRGLLDPCDGDPMYDYDMYGDDWHRKGDCDGHVLPPPPAPLGGGGLAIVIRADLLPTGADANATAVASFRLADGATRFQLAVKLLAAGDYDVMVDGVRAATLAVGDAGAGKLQIDASAAGPAGAAQAAAAPAVDPRGRRLEVRRDGETYLAVDFPATVEEAQRLARGVRITASLEAPVEGDPGRGTMEFRSKKGRDQLKLKLADLRDGPCTLRVGGVEVAGADVIRGKARLDFDSMPGARKRPLGFDPRGQLAQVLQGGEVALQVIFPQE